jgi:hypothetical protein
MTHRRAWAPFAFFALIVLIALLLAGLRGGVVRAYAVGVPAVRKVAVARPHHEVCEGPISSQYAFQSVVLWGIYVSGKPLVRVSGLSAAAKGVISAGLVERSPPGGYGRFTAKLRSSVAGDQAVEVCVSDPDGKLRLRGSTPGYTGVAIGGTKSLTAFSMVLLEPTRHSFLGSLSLAFSRAALFRPSWVGPWTFWVLLIALLGAIPVAAFAISAALRSEEDQTTK